MKSEVGVTMDEHKLTILGSKTTEPMRQLEVFKAPGNVEKICLTSDEVTSLCPVTKQPDWETVIIEYGPNEWCIESKSLKLYLWSFRNEGVFCEALASQIAADVEKACNPRWCTVKVIQRPRGGIGITATAGTNAKDI